MASIQQAVNGRHASTNTIMHALYGYFYLGLSKQRLATIYNKHINTISNWIQRFEADNDYQRRSTKQNGQLTAEQREWLLGYYTRHPVAFLDEAKAAFEQKFTRFISISTVWRALRQHGLTWKVLERRAMTIKTSDIVRFTLELNAIKWCQMIIQFLDEVSFDNRGILRTRGYSLKGKKLAFRGEFNRKARVSLLCFISVDGLVEAFHTYGTFDRSKFVECCRVHAHSRKPVHQYPGRDFVWILDGAKIHCHPDIVYYLRSLGIILPAYCPFYNPIEYLFGLIKKAFKRQYVEGIKQNQAILIANVLQQFQDFDMTHIFEHCGWSVTGEFDLMSALGDEYVSSSGGEQFVVSDLLEFSERADPDYDNECSSDEDKRYACLDIGLVADQEPVVLGMVDVLLIWNSSQRGSDLRAIWLYHHILTQCLDNIQMILQHSVHGHDGSMRHLDRLLEVLDLCLHALYDLLCHLYAALHTL